MADWFYAQAGQQYGPVTDADMRSLIAQRSVQPTDLAWKEGMGDWLPISSIPELASSVPQQVMTQPVQYYGQSPNAAPPPNYLVQSILVTICCCIPFGIPAIVYAAQVNGLHAQGNYHGALEKSASAKKWCWVAFIVGLVAGLINIGLQVAVEMNK